MAVLTISREIGSGGPDIGRMVAEKTGYHYADKKTMLDVFKQYGFQPFDKVYESPSTFWDRFDTMRQLTLQNLNDVIEALAHHGNIIIVGRGSFAVLGDLADVINVRIQAPFETRLRWFIQSEGLRDEEEAERLLVRQSEVRVDFVETTYHVPWDAASNFDMVFNTDKVSLDQAADWLCAALKSLEKADYSGRPTTRDLQVENFLVTAVSGALDCAKQH